MDACNAGPELRILNILVWFAPVTAIARYIICEQIPTFPSASHTALDNVYQIGQHLSGSNSAESASETAPSNASPVMPPP